MCVFICSFVFQQLWIALHSRLHVMPSNLLTHSVLPHPPTLALQLLATDANFLRVGKGAYSLHCFHPEVEQLVKAPQPKKRKALDFAGGRGAWWGLQAVGVETIHNCIVVGLGGALPLHRVQASACCSTVACSGWC